MEFIKTKIQTISVGDMLVTSIGKRIVIKENGKYALINLGGAVVTDWYEKIEELIEYYNILSVIKCENLIILEK